MDGIDERIGSVCISGHRRSRKADNDTVRYETERIVRDPSVRQIWITASNGVPVAALKTAITKRMAGGPKVNLIFVHNRSEYVDKTNSESACLLEYAKFADEIVEMGCPKRHGLVDMSFIKRRNDFLLTKCDRVVVFWSGSKKGVFRTASHTYSLVWSFTQENRRVDIIPIRGKDKFLDHRLR